jgi:hypothetical protein
MTKLKTIFTHCAFSGTALHIAQLQTVSARVGVLNVMMNGITRKCFLLPSCALIAGEYTPDEMRILKT